MDSNKIIIENNGNNWVRLELKKIWNYRSLIKLFTLRDIKLQYIQTKFGMIWSFVQAITAAFVINLFFGILLKFETGGVPYLIYAFPGLMAWYYFSFILNNSGNALVSSQHIIKKVYFPKLVLPFYRAMVGLFDVLVWLIVFFCICVLYGYPLSWKLLLLPLPIFLNIITGLSIAIWLSALTIRYRDAFLIIPFLAAFGIFVTPVFFPHTMIPEQYHSLIFMNPMAGVIELYRFCLSGVLLDVRYLYGFIPVVILLVAGLFYFRKVENTIADLI